MNIFCFVVDAAKGVSLIMEELKLDGALDGAIIAVSSEKETKVVWPNEFKGDFSI
jgi:hypothetical protein